MPARRRFGADREGADRQWSLRSVNDLLQELTRARALRVGEESAGRRFLDLFTAMQILYLRRTARQVSTPRA